MVSGSLRSNWEHFAHGVPQHVQGGDTPNEWPDQTFVYRKGATRALGPGHPDLPPVFAGIGQPVLIGGTMGTASYVMVGTAEGEAQSFASSCHGAGRSMSRHAAAKLWKGVRC